MVDSPVTPPRSARKPWAARTPGEDLSWKPMSPLTPDSRPVHDHGILPNRRPGSRPIARQGSGGRAARLRRRRRAVSVGRHPGGGLAGELGARASAWRRCLLQCEPAHQSDQCMRRLVPAVRVWQEEGRSGHVHDGARRGLATAASGYTDAVTEFHIVGGLHPDLPFEYFMDLVAG